MTDEHTKLLNEPSYKAVAQELNTITADVPSDDQQSDVSIGSNGDMSGRNSTSYQESHGMLLSDPDRSINDITVDDVQKDKYIIYGILFVFCIYNFQSERQSK